MDRFQFCQPGSAAGRIKIENVVHFLRAVWAEKFKPPFVGAFRESWQPDMQKTQSICISWNSLGLKFTESNCLTSQLTSSLSFWFLGWCVECNLTGGKSGMVAAAYCTSDCIWGSRGVASCKFITRSHGGFVTLTGGMRCTVHIGSSMTRRKRDITLSVASADSAASKD